MNRQKLAPEIEALHLAPLAPDEFERRLTRAVAELDGPDGEEVASLIRWFNRRYPTPAERLAYARRAYARWTAQSTATPTR